MTGRPAPRPLPSPELVEALSALAQPTRLEAWRLLMRYAPHGLSAGDVGRLVAVAHNTLSVHLAILERAGLVASRREGRHVIYAAAPARAREIFDALAATGFPRAAGAGETPARAAPAIPARRDPTMTARPFDVLVLCTGNSARSILAEALFNREGRGAIRAVSAGSQPKGEPNPHALSLLAELGYDTAGFRSKSWDEFSGEGAPSFDLVVTVCDNAAGEACPFFAGAPLQVHWGLEDPAAVEGSDEAKRAAFLRAYRELSARVTAFVNLPFATMNRDALREELERIGAMEGATALSLGRAA